MGIFGFGKKKQKTPAADLLRPALISGLDFDYLMPSLSLYCCTI